MELHYGSSIKPISYSFVQIKFKKILSCNSGLVAKYKHELTYLEPHQTQK